MFSTRINNNGHGVEKAFIHEIVANQAEYTCLPLYADVENLRAKNYRALGHMYNEETNTYSTSQVGGFVRFWEEEEPELGTTLYGEARIPRRDAEICAAIKEMYELGILSVSFEVRYSEAATKRVGKAMIIEAAPSNALTGMAIVSVPAYPEAVAVDLVAQRTERQMEEVRDEVNVNVNENDEQKKAAAEPSKANAATKDEVMIETNNPQAVNRAAEGEPQGPESEDESVTKANAAEEAAKAAEAKKEPEPKPEPSKKDPEPEAAKAAEASDAETRIAQLESHIAELESVCAELKKQIQEAEQKREMEAKTAKAQKYAEKIGLNAEDEEVKKAIASLDYEKMADLVLAQKSEPNPDPAAEPETKKDPEPVPKVFSSITAKDGFDPTFGGLISAR